MPGVNQPPDRESHTAPGDRVAFEADANGEAVFSMFRNESLANVNHGS